MAQRFPQSELEAYLDEALPSEEMARIEKALRADPDLAKQLGALIARRDAGAHSLGSIWRRRRVTCATREQLAQWVAYARANDTVLLFDAAYEAFVQEEEDKGGH